MMCFRAPYGRRPCRDGLLRYRLSFLWVVFCFCRGPSIIGPARVHTVRACLCAATMSTTSLPSYAAPALSFSRTPSYSEEPQAYEQRLAWNVAAPRPSGEITKQSRSGGVSLRFSGQESNASLPIYGHNGIVEGTVEVAKPEGVHAVEVKVRGNSTSVLHGFAHMPCLADQRHPPAERNRRGRHCDLRAMSLSCVLVEQRPRRGNMSHVVAVQPRATGHLQRWQERLRSSRFLLSIARLLRCAV